MIPTTRERRTTPCRRQPFHPTDRGADAHFECPSGTSTRGAFLNGIDHALTQVQRIAGWHGLFPNLSPGDLQAAPICEKSGMRVEFERIGKCSNESALPQDLERMLTNRSRIIEQYIERFSLPTAEDRDALWFNLALPDGHTKDGVCLPNPLPDILTLSERYNEWIAKSPA